MTNDTKVVHCKKQPYDVYIGRPSKFGNPFSHKEGTLALYKCATRKESIQRFSEWIMNGDGQHLLDDLHELRGKVLGCWCKPQPCHGDVLVELVNMKFQNNSKRFSNEEQRI